MIATPTWTDSAEHLTGHADDLLTEEAEAALTDLVAAAPEQLRYLGLLGLARVVGVDPAHSLLTGTTDEPNPPPEAELPLARLAAGFQDGSAEPQFAHALTALRLGFADEAVWAMTRCRDAAASWERLSFRRRLDEFAAAHPDLDVTAVREVLLGV